MDASTPEVAIIVALSAHGRAIGKDSKLLWHLPGDLKRFKELSLGHPVIMGRKTFESIVGYLGGPLPNRTNIVITRDAEWNYGGVAVFYALEDALEHAHELDDERIVIAGGAEIYAQALPYTDTLYLTLIDDKKDADTYFPKYEDAFPVETAREEREHDGLSYAWVTRMRSAK